jgi:hypothetical protein
MMVDNYNSSTHLHECYVVKIITLKLIKCARPAAG